MIKDIITSIPQLRKKSRKCPDDKIRQVVGDLIDTITACRIPALGLAAPQIGHKLSAFLCRDGSEHLCIVNPIVLRRFGGRKPSAEGCLSVPASIKRPIRVLRYAKIRVEYIDGLTHEVVTRTFRGLLAIVVQHELDHLDGIVIGDKRPGKITTFAQVCEGPAISSAPR